MGELSGNEIGHGDEVFDDATVVAGAGSGFPQCAVPRVGGAGVFAGLEAAWDAGQMAGDRPREAPERIEATALSPAEPALEQGPGFVRRSGRRVDSAQALVDALSASSLEVRALQPMNGLELRDGSCGMTLEQAPVRPLDFGLALDLGPADLVERLAAQGDDVEAVKAHCGLGEVLGGGAKRAADVDVEVRDCRRLPPVGGEIGRERTQRRLLRFWRGKQQPPGVESIRDCEMVVASQGGSLVHRDGADFGVRLPGARSPHLMPDYRPKAARGHAQPPTGGEERHRRGERQCQSFEERREAALLAPPGHQNLGHLSAFEQATRSTSACRYACSGKSICRHERSMRSCSVVSGQFFRSQRFVMAKRQVYF